jgi:uncharacterized glyoxalase superfamily protein PhnB
MATTSRSRAKAATGTTTASKKANSTKQASTAKVPVASPLRKLMIVGIYVRDQEAALDFYVNKLGFVKRTDIAMGPDARWLTVAPPDQQEIEITLVQPNETWHGAEGVAALMQRVGQSFTWSYITDNCQAAYETLLARGVEFTQPPKEEFYGIEAVCLDLYGNAISIVELKQPPSA